MAGFLGSPTHKPHRQWAIQHGGVQDHAGQVSLAPIPDFDLDQTIFGTLQGTLPRLMTTRRIGQSATWEPQLRQSIAQSFAAFRAAHPLPDIDPALLSFLEANCDFSAEHADGSFSEHLFFGYEYCLHHYPEQSARVMLLHSILGTGTNTFAMEAEHIPGLQALLTAQEWTHIAAFPSVLRLLYNGELLKALRGHPQGGLAVQGLACHRVIDNHAIELNAQELWIQLNYQLLHLIDFLPIANWYTQRSDPSFLVFRELHEYLNQQGKLQIQLAYDPTLTPRPPTQAVRPLKHRWMDHVPAALVQRFGAKAITQFSQSIGHSLDFRLL